MSFNDQRLDFNNKYLYKDSFTSLVPIHLTQEKKVNIKKKDGSPNEEYYKWQFIYSIVNSGLYDKQYLGTEIQFPKGNKTSTYIKIDAAIFDSVDWFEKYKDFHLNKSMESLEWLRDHLIASIEFKKEDNKNIPEVWEKQLKPYLKESERRFCLGVIYDTERLYLFKQHNGKYIRFNEEYNEKGAQSKRQDISIHLTDKYSSLPSFSELFNYEKSPERLRSELNYTDLDIISGIQSTQINDCMSMILRAMDKVNLVDQSGFAVLIQTLALKIYDEKENQKNKKRKLKFFIQNNERGITSLSKKEAQEFINRIINLRDQASSIYQKILKSNPIDFKNKNHIKVIEEVVYQFQDYSFVRSEKTDLYQLVFYKFATPFSKEQKSQFLTPLPIINFLVDIVNPRGSETILDPTVGIADFLSVSFVNSQSKLDDNNIFGIDIDSQMIMLATLNMLLNGDGNATLFAEPEPGSILAKFDDEDQLIHLLPDFNRRGNWDNRPDGKKLKKFDVILTNPPFGEDRAFEPKTEHDLSMIQCYETWDLYGGKKIDLGIVFLENAYRSLKEDGRLGIVISNSIASIDSHAKAREWLMKKMRIVGIFDLPSNIFAEVGVPTTLLVAYKPKESELHNLQEKNYEVFSKSIEKVGYEVKTSKRVKYFSNIYKTDKKSFEIEINEDGSPKLDEDFSETKQEFKEWCLSQEQKIKELFIDSK